MDLLLPPPYRPVRDAELLLRLRLADEVLRVDVLPRFEVEPAEEPPLPIKFPVLPLPIKPPLLLDELEPELPSSENEVTLPTMLPPPEELELLLPLDDLFDDCWAADSVMDTTKIPKVKAVTAKKQNIVRITNLTSEKQPQKSPQIRLILLFRRDTTFSTPGTEKSIEKKPFYIKSFGKNFGNEDCFRYTGE